MSEKPLHFGPWQGRPASERFRRTLDKKHKVSVWQNSRGTWRGESRKFGISFSADSGQAAEDKLDKLLKARSCILD